MRSLPHLTHKDFIRLLLLLLVYAIDVTISIRWIALNHAPHLWTDSSHCPQNKGERKKFGLVGSQMKLCKRITELMPVVMKAAHNTKLACQHQFHNRRWNCSSLDFAPKLSSDLTKGTREQAYVYALSSASVVHSVAKACVTGNLSYCPCGRLPNQKQADYKWEGCSDNVHYGKRVSEEWADAPWSRRKKKAGKKYGKARTKLMADRALTMRMEDFMAGDMDLTPRAKMNQHNNDVGRKVAEDSLRVKCKCHGVSGSCTMKSCWKILPPLVEIAATLQESYSRATEVRPIDESPTNKQFEPVALVGRVTHEDLVYIRKSPDYCTEDRRVGSFGTRGRVCNATLSSHGSCDSMCCGRGYETEQKQVETQCHCKFVYCCYVKCKSCVSTVLTHTCK